MTDASPHCLLPRAAALALPCASLLLPGACLAAGPWLTETGGADTAMAGAGRVALAIDAAAISANPAAIGELRGTQVTAAAIPIRLGFDVAGDAESSGRAPGVSESSWSGSAFAVRGTGQLALGLGAYSYAGLGIDYGDDWSGRYGVEEARMRSGNLAAAAAWRVSDRLDIGATAAAQYADVRGKIAVDNSAMFYGPPVDLPDGQVKLDGGDWSPGGSAGLLYRATDDTRIGLAWTLPVAHAIPLDVRASDLHPVLASLVPAATRGTMNFTLPGQLAVGLTRRVSPATLVGLGAAWQDWSRFGRATVSVMDRRVDLFPGGLRDTWNLSAGFRHELGPRWSVSAGLAYDSSPAKSAAMPAYFPVADQWRVSGGVEHRWGERLVTRLALSVIDQGDVHVAQPLAEWPLPASSAFTGSLRRNRAYVLAVASDFAD